jgi:hypothetical protein|nr:MAG TPA: hypothetical protein [Caudoviricetes sp.]
MNMEDLIFSKLQKGDTIYTLERDRRSGYPIFDTAKVLKVGESKPRATGPDGSFAANTEILNRDFCICCYYIPSHRFSRGYL